ncbi:hypothetical protein FZW96_15130 [Bacillus sp. BGMRC 2118]|nr:hypothetical protein FZW96_15130 [Bacillus sp. BGMRC 2118]
MLTTLLGLLLYRVLYRRKSLFTDRYGMIITMCCSGVLSLSISLNLLFLLSFPLEVTTLVNLLIGGIIGVGFGSLVKFQSVLAGYTHGVIGALMGTMLGAVIQNPTLCSLPASYLTSVQENMIFLSLFVGTLVCMTIGLIVFSLRV